MSYIRMWLHRQYLWSGLKDCCFFVFSCSSCLKRTFFFFYVCSGKPTCRCNVGFSGPFCERRICDNYCLNGGTCDVTQGNQPVCRCMAEYTGDRCLYRESCTHCLMSANTTDDYCHAFRLHMIDFSLSSLATRAVTTKKSWIWLFSIKSVELSISKFTHTACNKNNPQKYALSTNTAFASICR